MKKQLLIATGILLSTIANAQEKFYTSNFSKEVKELNTSMKTIEFSSVLPSNYKNYDDIVADIDSKDVGLIDRYSFGYYDILTPVKNVPSDGKVKYIIEAGSDKKGDFSGVYYGKTESFDIFHSLNFKERTYRFQTVAVKIMGRVKTGMHWVNDEYVPKYKYTELSFTEIQIDLGEPEPTYTTASGLFTYNKYKAGKMLTQIYPGDDSEDLTVFYEHDKEDASKIRFNIYEIEAGEIKQESFDMSGGAPKASSGISVDGMIKEIKLNLKKTILKSSCYNEARSVKLIGQRLAETKVEEGIYEPYMLDADKKEANAGGNALGTLKSIGGQFGKKKPSKDMYNTFINSPESDLKWEQKKLGNYDVEMLELDFYKYKQCTSSQSNESFKINSGEEGKTQKVIIFLTKIDGKLFAGSFTKEADGDMNADDLKFVDSIISTFKVNK